MRLRTVYGQIVDTGVEGWYEGLWTVVTAREIVEEFSGPNDDIEIEWEERLISDDGREFTVKFKLNSQGLDVEVPEELKKIRLPTGANVILSIVAIVFIFTMGTVLYNGLRASASNKGVNIAEKTTTVNEQSAQSSTSKAVLSNNLSKDTLTVAVRSDTPRRSIDANAMLCRAFSSCDREGIRNSIKSGATSLKSACLREAFSRCSESSVLRNLEILNREGVSFPKKSLSSRLCRYVNECNVEKVSKLLKLGANPNVACEYGERPLHLVILRAFKNPDVCSSQKAERIVELLLNKGANVYAKNGGGYTPRDLLNDLGSGDYGLYQRLKSKLDSY